MRQVRGLSAFVVVAAMFGLLAAASASAQAPATTILVFHGPPDATVDAGVAAIEALGAANDFEVETSQSAADFTAANLDSYRAIVFLGNAGNALNAAQESALQGYINGGGGFVGIGGAAEGEPGSTFYGNLIGARPTAGSPTGTAEKVVEVGDRVHPGDRGRCRSSGPARTSGTSGRPGPPARSTPSPATARRRPRRRRHRHRRHRLADLVVPRLPGRPLLLHRHGPHRGELRPGRLPDPPARRDPVERRHGPRRLQGDHRRQLQRPAPRRRLDAATSTHTGESHGVAPAPNGWVFYIGRADCRTDAQRGQMIGTGPTPRILDFANRNVGIGCGNVHIWDPAAANGTVNSGVTLAGILPVYGDRGAGDEINGKIEAGLLGIAISPDFAQTGPHLPAVLPDLQPGQPGPPGPRRRRPAAHHEDGQAARSRRFTVDLATKQLELDSEVVIFEYESQIYSCCHRGGGMGFDSEGNLYVTTGDSNSSQRTNGTSGNYQPARCPTGDPDGRLQQPLRQQQHLLQRRAPHSRQHQRLQRQDAALQPRRHDPRRVAADGRRQQHLHAADRRLAQRREPLQRHRGQRQPGQAGDLRDGPAQPVAPVHRPRDRHPVLGVGRPRRRLAVARPSARRPTRTPPSSPRPATTAGPTAWATSRPTATASPTARCAPPTPPAS